MKRERRRETVASYVDDRPVLWLDVEPPVQLGEHLERVDSDKNDDTEESSRVIVIDMC